MQIVPDALIEQTRNELERIFNNIIVKRVVVISLRKEMYENAQAGELLELEDKLRDARTRGHIVLCPPTQIKKLLLKYIDFVNSIQDTNPLSVLMPNMIPEALHETVNNLLHVDVAPKLTKLKVMSSILRLFRAGDQSKPGNSGAVAIIDECDMIFEPLKSELNFPFGKRSKIQLAPQRWTLPLVAIEALVSAFGDGGVKHIPPKVDKELWLLEVQKLREVIDEGLQKHFILRKPSILLLEKSWYTAHLCSPIARCIVLWLQTELPTAFFSTHQDAILSYISGGPSNRALFQCIEEPSWKGSATALAPNDQTALLQLARRWATSLLPHCLSKRHSIDYGLLQGKHIESWKERFVSATLSQNRLLLAVPFQGMVAIMLFRGNRLSVCVETMFSVFLKDSKIHPCPRNSRLRMSP